jgi:prepilin-type processing-associated H-X9-DG protein
VNNLKQFSLACMIYADANDNKLPKDIDTLLNHKEFELKSDVCNNIIYLAGNLDYSKLQSPATTPIAICDRCSHNEDKVCILFADGHVESTDVPEEADDEKVLILLQKQYGFDREYLKFIQTQLAKEEE